MKLLGFDEWKAVSSVFGVTDDETEISSEKDKTY
jgi:hypothetical protein